MHAAGACAGHMHVTTAPIHIPYAAAAYLDGYQNYPKSKKAPINLLKLGSTLVKMGEKEQGCLMILGVKKEYPKASQSVLQKAEYEKKKFKCTKA